MEEQIIHIQWTGPFTLEQAIAFHGKTDYGVYQVHGHHPIYGGSVLIYLGMAQKQTFGVRLLQEHWEAWEENHGSVSFYLGRPSGATTPDAAIWDEHIARAERLLIYAHRPAHNASGLNRVNDPDVGRLHILNWGNRGGLLPEVSGARWSERFAWMSSYGPYGSHFEENAPIVDEL